MVKQKSRRYIYRAGHYLLPLICLVLVQCGGKTTLHHVGEGGGWECAPFARAMTGVNLHGSAASWWSQADGLYDRTQAPRTGNILVFRPTTQMPDGHVAVVAAVESPRRILVTHANWVPHRVFEDQPVEDVSAAGDWTDVKVWWPSAKQLGSTPYRTFGFIRPDRRADRTGAATNTLAAIRTSRDGR